MILLNDFRRQWHSCGTSVLSAFRRVGESGWYILGKEVERFERSLAEFWRLAHVVGVANGMDAVEIALRVVGVSEGEMVLTTPLSAFATTLAIMRAGGKPCFVDVDESGQIDLDQCREVLRSDRLARCMVPVHLYGFACRLKALEGLRGDFDLRIIEDCAQSIGAEECGIRVGTVGQVAATSFYPTKNLGAMGDGGAILTNDKCLAERARAIRNYGQSEQYTHSELGLNSRLDELHAAILNDAFLPRLGSWTERRRQIADHYLRSLDNPHVIPLPRPPSTSPVWHLFPVQVPPEKRESFQRYMKQEGVLTGIHYPRVILDQPALQKYRQYDVAFPPERARRIAASEVSLPVHPFLTDEEVETVVGACNRWQA